MEEELINLDPQFVCIAEDRSIGLKGYVVVDQTIDNHACGGIRMVPDLSIGELKGLARCMTLKYGFSELEQGGAKAGIVADYDLPANDKQILLRRFGEIITPLLKSGYYITGMDINTTKDEIIDMLDYCKISVPRKRRRKGNKSGFFTAMSVMVGTEAVASFRKFRLFNSSIAIEGFGAVGSSYAWLMSKKKGAKIVAISTIKGAIYNKNGLDIDKLLQLKEKHKDDLINHYVEADKTTNEMLLELDVDILSPCARHFSINDSNALKIKAPVICPGANIPVTSSAEKTMFNREMISIPSFVNNCGGVIGNKLEMLSVADDIIENLIRKKLTPKIIHLIEKSYDLQIPMCKIAEEEAMKNFHLMQVRNQSHSLKNLYTKLAKKLINTGLIPEFIMREAGEIYFNRKTKNEKSNMLDFN